MMSNMLKRVCLCSSTYVFKSMNRMLSAGSSKGHELSEALANILLGKKKTFEKVNIAER